MIRYVSDIMIKEIITINALDSLYKAKNIMMEKDTDCLPVMDNNELVGILTWKDVLRSHPNRIVADAMTNSFISITSNTSIWKAKDIFEKNKAERLLVIDDGEFAGLVTKSCIYVELAKYTDFLIDLYKSDYIYHIAANLIASGMEISVIFIEVEIFGDIDKKYGRVKGDIILKELGKLLNNRIPSDTFLCRFGGDEFVILTPYKLDKCKILAENLLKTIASHSFPDGKSVTVSAGIAGGRRNDIRECNALDTISNLINLASLASTHAKKEKLHLAIAEGFSISK